MRLLAAALALLMTLGSIAHAGVPGRPIDRSGGPPDPVPTQVGDPDTGNNGLWAYLRQFVLAAQLNNPYLRTFTAYRGRASRPALKLNSLTLRRR
jgi:hypothetical protein